MDGPVKTFALLPWEHGIEKAAVVWLNSPPSPNDLDLFAKIWNSSFVRYCADGSANTVLKYQQQYNLKSPDFCVGDFDSLAHDTRKCFEKETTFIHTPCQDQTDFTKLLLEVTKNEDLDNVEKIIVLGGLSGRFDQTMSVINSLLMFGNVWNGKVVPHIFVVDQNNLVMVCNTGTTLVHIPQDRQKLTGITSFVPIMQQKTIVTTRGFKWDVVDQEICFGGLVSTSNQIDGNVLSVTTTQPILLHFELSF
uniref:Thiamine diphosphokinase n=1 Tax=Rhabditophanes sp. KR3021 TaxID=114890 RepID=A0AC35UEX0_9BILA